jgi:hypothetical protein
LKLYRASAGGNLCHAVVVYATALPSIQRQLPIPALSIPQHEMEGLLYHVLPKETDKYLLL